MMPDLISPAAKRDGSTPPFAADERLRLALEIAAMATWEWELASGRITLSDEAASLFGASSGHIDALKRLMHPDDHASVRAAVGRALRNEAPYELEYRLLLPGGGIRWVAVRGHVKRNAAGAPVRILGVCADITAQRSAEARLKRDALILANVRESVIVTDTDGLITYWNQGAEEIFGWTEAEMLGRPVVERFPPETRPQIAELIRVVTGGEEFSGEFEDRRKDGTRIWIEARVRPLYDNDRLAGLVGVSRDITERKRAEQALSAREREFKAVVENARDIIARFDRDGRHLYINPVIQEVSGRAPSEYLGRTNRELGMPPEQCDHWESAIAEVFQTGKERSIEFSFPAPGGMRHFHSRIVPESWHMNTVQTVTAITRDLTERLHAEENLARKAAELARSNAELESFAYIASHDLKEPLRGIANYAHFLLEDYAAKLDEDGVSKLQTLKSLAMRMDRLIDALLEFSRVGRTELALEWTDLETVVHDVLASLRPRLEEVSAQVTVSTLPAVYCDSVRVRELIFNLITNAFKYNDRDVKSIHIGALPGSPPDDPVIFVRDNGIGIAEHHQAKLFTMFKRLHARDKYGGGTGAGLALAKRIVERHGGRIWLESTFGDGTTVYFNLPQRSASS